MAKRTFRIDIKGEKDVMKRIDEVKRKIKEDVDLLIETTIFDINDDAINNIRSNNAIDLGAGGGLISHQFVTQDEKGSWTVGNSSFYAPFIEWGTGQQVSVPAEWQEIASKYKGPYPGTWTEFEQNIKAWMRRHGMDADQSYPLMIHILRKGLKPRPFLYPAYVKNKEKLLQQLKELFKR